MAPGRASGSLTRASSTRSMAWSQAASQVRTTSSRIRRRSRSTAPAGRRAGRRRGLAGRGGAARPPRAARRPRLQRRGGRAQLDHVVAPGRRARARREALERRRGDRLVRADRARSRGATSPLRAPDDEIEDHQRARRAVRGPGSRRSPSRHFDVPAESRTHACACGHMVEVEYGVSCLTAPLRSGLEPGSPAAVVHELHRVHASARAPASS